MTRRRRVLMCYESPIGTGPLIRFGTHYGQHRTGDPDLLNASGIGPCCTNMRQIPLAQRKVVERTLLNVAVDVLEANQWMALQFDGTLPMLFVG